MRTPTVLGGQPAPAGAEREQRTAGQPTASFESKIYSLRERVIFSLEMLNGSIGIPYHFEAGPFCLYRGAIKMDRFGNLTIPSRSRSPAS